jgi:hypothetical protein
VKTDSYIQAYLKIKVMKKVLLITSILALGFGCILVAGGNDLGYIGFVLGLIGLYIVDKSIVLGE